MIKTLIKIFLILALVFLLVWKITDTSDPHKKFEDEVIEMSKQTDKEIVVLTVEEG